MTIFFSQKTDIKYNVTYKLSENRLIISFSLNSYYLFTCKFFSNFHIIFFKNLGNSFICLSINYKNSKLCPLVKSSLLKLSSSLG